MTNVCTQSLKSVTWLKIETDDILTARWS